MLKQVVNRLRLVRAARLAAVTAELRSAQRSAAKRAAALDQLRNDNQELKARVKVAETVARRAEAMRAGDQQKLKALETRLGQLTSELEQQTRNTASQLDAEPVQRRLRDAVREIKITREYLTVLQSKIDLLEAASRVLDTRTREVTRQHRSTDGAADVTCSNG